MIATTRPRNSSCNGCPKVAILNRVLSSLTTEELNSAEKNLDMQLAEVEGLLTKLKQLSEDRAAPDGALKTNLRFSSSSSTPGFRHSGSTKALYDGRVRRRQITSSTSSSRLARVGTFELKMKLE